MAASSAPKLRDLALAARARSSNRAEDGRGCGAARGRQATTPVPGSRASTSAGWRPDTHHLTFESPTGPSSPVRPASSKRPRRSRCRHRCPRDGNPRPPARGPGVATMFELATTHRNRRAHRRAAQPRRAGTALQPDRTGGSTPTPPAWSLPWESPPTPWCTSPSLVPFRPPTAGSCNACGSPTTVRLRSRRSRSRRA